MVRSEHFRGAVLGTFSGILVGLVAFFIGKYHETRSKRYNALCYIEQILNCLLVSIRDNQWQIEKALVSEEVTLMFPSELKIVEENIREISRIDLKNKLLEVLIDCQRYGQSLAGAIKLFEVNVETFRAFRGQQFGSSQQDIVQSIIKDFYRQFKTKLRELHEFGNAVEQGIEESLVETRFFGRNDRLWLSRFDPYYSEKDLKRWRRVDLERLQEERKQTAARDEARRSKNV